jgi:hypothetical protein
MAANTEAFCFTSLHLRKPKWRPILNLVFLKSVYLTYFPEQDSAARNKAKRVRTTFTDEQLQVLQANFQLDSNPDGQDLERIAQITGLSKRVTQVWFQNSRARQKKHQQQTTPGDHNGMDSSHGMPSSPTSSPAGESSDVISFDLMRDELQMT